MRSNFTKLALAAALLLPAFSSAPLAAQGVGIDPNMVVVSSTTRSGSLTLLNTRSQPVEVELTLQYGFAGTDSAGQSTVEMPDVVGEGEPDATGWITIFPRRLTIPPQSDQTIKFLARPPAGLPDGEYWSRVIIKARTGAAPVETVGATNEGITVGLTMETRTIIPLFYRKGRVSAGATISQLSASQMGDSVLVTANLERTGEAAWLGTVTLNLVDAKGTVVASMLRNHAAYTKTAPRYTIPIPADLPSGNYTVEMVLGTERTDVQDYLRIPTTGASATVQVPIAK